MDMTSAHEDEDTVDANLSQNAHESPTEVDDIDKQNLNQVSASSFVLS